MKSPLLIALALALSPAAAAQDDATPSEAGEAQPGQLEEEALAELEAATAKDKAVHAIDAFIKRKGKPSDGDGWRVKLKLPPKVKFDPDSEYFWHIRTNVGDVTIKLMPDVAPMHVSSTIYLARTGFYDGIIFHRVIRGFMAQGGCPLGNGMGGPGYAYDVELDPELKHDRAGLLSMANTGAPKSDASQFFLTFAPAPHLDGVHTIFGEVIGEGLKTVRELEKCGSKTGTPTKYLKMEKTWISVVHTPKEDAGDEPAEKKKKRKKKRDNPFD